MVLQYLQLAQPAIIPSLQPPSPSSLPSNTKTGGPVRTRLVNLHANPIMTPSFLLTPITINLACRAYPSLAVATNKATARTHLRRESLARRLSPEALDAVVEDFSQPRVPEHEQSTDGGLLPQVRYFYYYYDIYSLCRDSLNGLS